MKRYVAAFGLRCFFVALCMLLGDSVLNAAVVITTATTAPSDHVLTGYSVGYDNFAWPVQWTAGAQYYAHEDIAQSFLVSGASDWNIDKITIKVREFGTSVASQPYSLEVWTVSDAADTSGNLLVSSQSATFPGSGLAAGYWTFDLDNVTLTKETYYAFVLGFDSGPNAQRYVNAVMAYSAYDLFPDGRMFFRQGTPPAWAPPPHVSDKDFDFYVQGNAVPEPASLAIWSLLGTVGVAVTHRRRRKAA